MKFPSSSQILAAQHRAKKSKAIDRAYKKPIPRNPNIPDLRSPQWQRWDDPQAISKATNYARWLCQQSEQQTGICVARSLEAREAKIAAQFMKELI